MSETASLAHTSPAPGPLALVGGAEWTGAGEFDAQLLRMAGGEVLVLPTAAAYERPERAVATAEAWFSKLGGRARGLMVLARRDAEEERNAALVRESRFTYIGGGSPLHLRSVLKGSRVWNALFDAWENGAVVAGSSAGAMVLTDPMVDPRGGAFTLGLGLVREMSVIPHFGSDSAEMVHRTLALAPSWLPVVGIPERTALIRDRDGSWRVAGEAKAQVFVGGKPASLESLPR